MYRAVSNNWTFNRSMRGPKADRKAKTFNNLPAELRSLDSRLKFKNKLRDYFS